MVVCSQQQVRSAPTAKKTCPGGPEQPQGLRIHPGGSFRGKVAGMAAPGAPRRCRFPFTEPCSKGQRGARGRGALAGVPSCIQSPARVTHAAGTVPGTTRGRGRDDLSVQGQSRGRAGAQVSLLALLRWDIFFAQGWLGQAAELCQTIPGHFTSTTARAHTYARRAARQGVKQGWGNAFGELFSTAPLWLLGRIWDPVWVCSCWFLSSVLAEGDLDPSRPRAQHPFTQRCRFAEPATSRGWSNLPGTG